MPGSRQAFNLHGQSLRHAAVHATVMLSQTMPASIPARLGIGTDIDVHVRSCIYMADICPTSLRIADMVPELVSEVMVSGVAYGVVFAI
jgi:hypothetical protein